MQLETNVYRIIGIVLVGILSLSILFHISIVFGIVPYNIVWGGRVHNLQELYIFESISLMINATLLFFVSVKIGIVTVSIPNKIVTWVLYAASFLLFLNTLGNLASINDFERMVFTPITLILAILLFILARSDSVISSET